MLIQSLEVLQQVELLGQLGNLNHLLLMIVYRLLLLFHELSFLSFVRNDSLVRVGEALASEGIYLLR